jgi:ssDNA-binding Zn-finger/Zn-ribbon topoisomerase 1
MPDELPEESVLGGILGRARATARRLDAENASLDARTCPSCRAARPADSDLRRCDYCGWRYMSSDVTPP